MRAIADQGYTHPIPIQSQAILLVLAGRDLLGAAQTGTGKTAGFALPILCLADDEGAEISSASAGAATAWCALILTPTRELAAQVQGERAHSTVNICSCVRPRSTAALDFSHRRMRCGAASIFWSPPPAGCSIMFTA